MTSNLEGAALVIASLGTLLTAAGTFVSAIYSIRTHSKTVQNGKDTKQLSIDIDGKMNEFMNVKDELTKARVDGSFTAGVQHQKEMDANE